MKRNVQMIAFVGRIMQLNAAKPKAKVVRLFENLESQGQKHNAMVVYDVSAEFDNVRPSASALKNDVQDKKSATFAYCFPRTCPASTKVAMSVPAAKTP